MPSTNYEEILTEKLHHREQLKRFASSLSRIEARLEKVPKKVLVNGIIVEDVFRAQYEFEDLGQVQELLEGFLSIPELDPDILINGIPGRPFDVEVAVDLRQR